MAIQAAVFRAQLEAIAKRISDGYTDREIMHDLKIKRATFYSYKSKIFRIYGDLAEKRSDESLEFEAETLKERYIRLYRNLELKLYDKAEPLEDIAYATDIAANIATNILRLEAEGLRARQLRRLHILEQKTTRYLGDHGTGPGSTTIQEPDNAGTIYPASDTVESTTTPPPTTTTTTTTTDNGTTTTTAADQTRNTEEAVF